MKAMNTGIEIQTTAQALTFSVHVLPRSSVPAFAGSYNNALKIKLTAPPAQGAANKQCCQLLAKALSIPKSSIEIISGHTSRHKRLRIHIAAGHDDPKAIKALAAKVQSLAL